MVLELWEALVANLGAFLVILCQVWSYCERIRIVVSMKLRAMELLQARLGVFLKFLYTGRSFFPKAGNDEYTS